MYSPIEVAQYFLWRTYQDEDLISNLKLQKLLYYAQGYSLAYRDRPLFDAPIFAWDHGPVVKEIYHEYKEYGRDNIPCPKYFHIEIYKEEDHTILEEVYRTYSEFSAWKLREMTHNEQPWQNTQKGQVMKTSQLKEYFKEKIKYRPIVVQAEAASWDEIAEEILRERRELWEKLAKV